jgi:hypothetical protein
LESILSSSATLPALKKSQLKSLGGYISGAHPLLL